MALTYVFLASPASGAAIALSGKSYTANGAGVITGVLPADALTLQGVAGASLLPILATGATTDRPGPQPATALTGAVNNISPYPANPLLPFYDTTLSKTVYYVGTQRSSTGWVDQAGNAA